MPIITKNNERFRSFLKDARFDHTMGKTINFIELQKKYNVSDRFVKAIFANNIIVNIGTNKYPIYYWKSDDKIDNQLIIKLRLWLTNNKN